MTINPRQLNNDPLTTCVVIVTHNRPEGVEVTLRSLAEGHQPEGLKKVVVIENGKRDSGSASVTSQYESSLPLLWRFHPDRRLAAARNSGIFDSGQDLVCIFDDDVIVGPDTITAYLDAAMRHGPGHFFGGPLDVEQETAPPNWLTPYLPFSARGFSLGDIELLVEEPCFLGANFAAFRSDLVALGGYPEYLGTGNSYPASGEEFCLQQRMLKKGFVGVYSPQARVRHLVPETRCTRAFAIHRNYRLGMTTLLMEFLEHGKSVPKKVPRWMWRRLVELVISNALQRLLKTEQERIESDIDFARFRGEMAAYRVLRNISLARGGGGHANDASTAESAPGSANDHENET